MVTLAIASKKRSGSNDMQTSLAPRLKAAFPDSPINNPRVEPLFLIDTGFYNLPSISSLA
jgi:hypothetical protein